MHQSERKGRKKSGPRPQRKPSLAVKKVVCQKNEDKLGAATVHCRTNRQLQQAQNQSQGWTAWMAGLAGSLRVVLADFPVL